MIAEQALQRLREGNQRFVAGEMSLVQRAQDRSELVAEQRPSAIILGCSDSRVPAELVFDQGLGELFVIRVAGNIVAPSQVGSVEFAAEQFGTRLVVVLGHSGCGAVAATLASLDQKAGEVPNPNLRAIVERIRPSVQGFVEQGNALTTEQRLHHAVRANIRHSADHLRNGSPILERLIAEQQLRVVGAEYNLATGMVDFFDGV